MKKSRKHCHEKPSYLAEIVDGIIVVVVRTRLFDTVRSLRQRDVTAQRLWPTTQQNHENKYKVTDLMKSTSKTTIKSQV